MLMGTDIRDLRTIVPGVRYYPPFPHQTTMTNRFVSESLPNNGSVSSALVPNPAHSFVAQSLSPTHASDSSEDSEIFFPNIDLSYISQMLLEEDIDEKFEQYPEHPALLAAEKPFLEILGGNPFLSPDPPPVNPSYTSESPDPPLKPGYASESPDGSSGDNHGGSCNTETMLLDSAEQMSFLEILGVSLPPSPDQPTILSNHSSGSPGNSFCNIQSFCNVHGNFSSASSSSLVVDGNSWPYDPIEHYQLQTNPHLDLSKQSSFSAVHSPANLLAGLDSSLNMAVAPDLITQNEPVLQFNRGVEEARKFLPGEDKLVIDLETRGFSHSPPGKVKHESKFEKKLAVGANGFHLPGEVKAETKSVQVKVEEAEIQAHSGQKHMHSDGLEYEEGRSNKHSAVSSEELVREMFDKVLLCNGEKCAKGVIELREALQSEAAKHSHAGHSKGPGNGKGRGKKQSRKEVFDLSTLLIHCAQAAATDDRRSATELLKQIRQHSSAKGDGNQRLAHCFADGLEARLAGTGSQIYQSFTMKRYASTDILKACQLYLAACPFKKVSHFFSNQTILDAAEKATKLHIIDYGIYYGFQWPCLIQRLSTRPGGPPRLRITGIDLPQPGFRPAERIEETGRRLADYARTFKVPFEYQPIAASWETIQIEDLNIDKDELLVVNSLYKFKTLMDESVVVDSPRNRVLNTIRKMNPHVFIHGVVNGSYNAPFFVTRFREAMFHFSALFDMLETNVPREDEHRVLLENILFRREAVNVISCEGLERMERPETYKQWQVRTQRAGFEKLPLNVSMMQRARDKVRCYHKDFIIDEDNQWLLQGWKGRIMFALSIWKPNHAL